MTDPYSIRLSPETEERLWAVLQACDADMSRADIMRTALDCFLAQLSVCPGMLPGYDRARDKSVIQNAKS